MNSDAVFNVSITIVALLIPINAFLFVWVARFKLESLEAALTDCKLVSDSKRHWNTSGALGRQMRLGMVASCFFFLRLWARHGLVDADQVRRVPRRLKCWVYIPNLAGVVLITASLILLVASGDITI
nr:hypothetical protein [uncultured Pseudomonas sp.]